MLFDLRGRGRRRTGAGRLSRPGDLFGLSFIGFGVGTGLGGGGVFEGLFGSKERLGRRRLRQTGLRSRKAHQSASKRSGRLGALAEARFHNANGSEFYDEEKQQFTAKGKEQLTKVVDAWSRYVALNPKNPPLTIAYDMVRVFGEEGLNQPGEAVAALQLVIPSKPASVTLYGDLAKFAYQAKNTSVGELAAKKTISLTPAADRKGWKQSLAQLKSNPTGNPSNENVHGDHQRQGLHRQSGRKRAGTIIKTSPPHSAKALEDQEISEPGRGGHPAGDSSIHGTPADRLRRSARDRGGRLGLSVRAGRQHRVLPPVLLRPDRGTFLSAHRVFPGGSGSRSASASSRPSR